MSSTETEPLKESRKFQAETSQLLDLMIHSLYTHKEIFLRELISNASDALDKLRFRSLTEPALMEDDNELEIWLSIDKEAHTISISDNGIGMTKQEVIDNIGTIAQSGSKAFLKAVKESREESTKLDLIGQFGVGFYSAFMVGQNIVLETRAAGQQYGVRWESTGEGEYTLEPCDRSHRGTTITIQLRNELIDPERPEEDYLNQYTIQNLVKRYSDYIAYKVKMTFVTDEYPRDEKGERIADAEPIKKESLKTLNSQTPIWEREKKDVPFDEYFQFYKHHFKDWNEPADIIRIKVEGHVTYTALLFIPSQAPLDFYSADYKKGVQLYCRHVFVLDNCRDLLPDHLRFVRGLVDSPDFSLNISREILQHDRQLKLIGKNLEKKVMSALTRLMQKKRKEYEAWWKEFGKAIKGGIYMHYSNKEKLQDLLLFPSSRSQDDLTSLAEYVGRMPEQQKHIFYETGRDRAAIERLPQMEVIGEKNLEVLYFLDKVDEFLTQNLSEYNEKKLKSISRGDLDLEDGPEKEESGEKEAKDKAEESGKHEDLLAAIKDHLGDKVKEVRLSKRLKSSPVCLVSSDSGPSFNMEMLMKEANQITPRATRILELNPKHQLFTGLEQTFEKDAKAPIIKDYSELLYSQAMLIEGFTLDDPVAFAECLNRVMARAQQ